MGLKLYDVMKISPFSQAKLIGGVSGLDRIVESANIQEVPDVERWLKGKEILFSSGYAFTSVDSGCRMMERLCQMGVAALAMKPGTRFPRIPAEMIDCSNRIGFPLFELPTDLPYMDCIIPIFERINEEQLAILRRVETIHERLMQAMLQEEGLDSICTVLSQAIDNPIYILAPRGEILASCSPSVADSMEKDAIGEYLQAYFEKADMTKMQRNQCNAVILKNGHAVKCVPIFVRDEHAANLILDTLGDKMVYDDLVAIEHASSLIAIEFLNEKALMQKELIIKGQVLDDILVKRYSDSTMMIQRGQYVGFDLTQPYCVFDLRAESFEDYAKTIMDSSSSDIQRIQASILDSIHQGMQVFPGQLLLMNDGIGVVGMFGAQSQKSVQACRDTIRELIKELDKNHPKLFFNAGISRVKDGIDQAGLAWNEAKLAQRVGRELNGALYSDHVCRFDDLGCLSFLCEVSKSPAVRAFYDERLSILVDYDEANNSDLIRTLRTYYDCDQNQRRAAATLCIHKNSLIYRLKKIESILGKQLSDSHTAFELQLCLQLKHIIDPRSPAPLEAR